MYQIDAMSRVPVYEQIINQTERFLMLGILSEGDKIPSVRSLATQLSINPNTIQKAFSIMDQRELIISVPGRGCFVKMGALEVIKAGRRRQLQELKEEIKELSLAGITKQEIYDCIEEVFQGKEKDHDY